jgi:Domain of unknown function (DUF4389)
MTTPQFTTAQEAPYPVTFDVAYPDRELNRLTTFFRLFTLIPIAIVLGALSGGASTTSFNGAQTTFAAGGGVLVGGPLLMILFRQKYPRWWFDWNLELTRFSSRVGVYAALMDDRYPSTDDHQSVTLEIEYPDVQRDLNRWLPLVKWLLAIPHYIVLFVLSVGAVFVVIFAWFAILFTGRYPRGAFEYLVGVGRWSVRVTAYVAILSTDRYPPFSLQP